MPSSKLYLGRKVRALREAQSLTQAAFSARVGISPSYLNQIENNQRPVSAQVLIALMETFNLNVADVAQSDGDRLLAALSEIASDRVFEGQALSTHELRLVAYNAPGFARMLLASHEAYRRGREQLASIDHTLGLEAVTVNPTPYEEVRDFFHFKDNYIHELDVVAERLAADLDIGRADPGTALARHLETRHGVRVALEERGGPAIRWFDAEAKVLFLNRYLSRPTRNFQMAFQIARLEMAAAIDASVRGAALNSAEARDICRIGLCNYFAGATILPYRLFLDAAAGVRHDLERLAAHFQASLEQVAHRLSTLQRPEMKGVPFFFARIDRAGNITKRHSATRFQFARFGAACPLWNAHEAFERPGQFLRQLAETPDGIRYLSVAFELAKVEGGFDAPRRRFAIVLGCEIGFAPALVYANGLDVAKRTAFDQIGVSCRICERRDCPQRAVPPLNATLEIAPDQRDVLPYRLLDGGRAGDAGARHGGA